MLISWRKQTTEEKSRGDREELEELLLAIAGEDREALGRLYAKTRGAVYAAALAVVHNAVEAQDVTQDVYVQVWEKAGLYTCQGKPMSWLLAVTRNLARSRTRWAGWGSELKETEWEAIPAEAPRVTPEDRLFLQEALAQLPEGDREVVLLYAVSGLRHREIADLLGIPLNTALSRYSRALAKLRKTVKGWEEQ